MKSRTETFPEQVPTETPGLGEAGLARTDSVDQKGVGSLLTRATLFVLITAAVCLSDLVTKSLMFDWLFDATTGWQEPYWIINGLFGFQPSLNPGALFGFGKGQSWLFALVSVVFLAGILGWFFGLGGWRDRWLVVATGLISGGILGNLYDRLGLGALPGFPDEHGRSVRDWILFQLNGVPMFDPWPNFNLADTSLVIGAGLVLIHGFFLSGREEIVVPNTKGTASEP